MNSLATTLMRRSTAFALALLLALCAAVLSAQTAHAQSVNAGTTLSAEKTATGFFERHIKYDWSLQKSADPSSLTISRGESGLVNYTLDATRTEVSRVDSHGVRGEICVTNGGDRTTENLKLVDQVQFKTGAGQFQDLAGASQTIIPAQQLGPGESKCYPYEITFEPVAGATYRNTVKVTITNHSGHIGEQFGPEPKADFSLPADPTITEQDESAKLSDSLSCPAGFSCASGLSPNPQTLSDSGVVQYSVRVTNDSAPCDTHFNLDNTAALLESDSGARHVSSASVDLYTGPCTNGCTLTIGYWKTHAGFTGNNADRVSPLLPVNLGTSGGAKTVTVSSAQQAVNILSFSGDASNGINKLYAQLLGAKLNIANGADGAAVASTISAADSFLASNNAANWAGLSRAQKNTVLGWATTLDNYNNGLTGPGHCDS